MRNLKGFIYKLIVFIGVFGYNLVAANTHVMNYDDNQDVVDSLLGVDVDVDDDGILIDPDIELEGIGRIMRGKTFDVKHVLQRIDRARRNYRRMRFYRNVKSVITPTQRFIAGNKAKFDAVTQKMISNKELQYSDGFLYYTKEYKELSGTRSIIQSNDTIGVGYSNLLENGIVQKGQILAVKFFGFMYNEWDTGASETIFTNEFEKAYGREELSNAEVEIVINGKVEYTVPVFMMNETREFSGAIPAALHMGINLERPILIKPDDRVNFNLKMAEGTSIIKTGTERLGIRMVLAGSGTKTK